MRCRSGTRLPLPSVLAVAALCVGVTPAIAQDSAAAPSGGAVAIERITFVPSTFHVGDVVEVRIDLHTAREPAAPEAAATGPWLVIHGLSLLPRGADRWELRVTFSVFQAGVRTLPAIDLGTFRIENLKAQADSVLTVSEEGTVEALRPLHPQVAVPGTAGAILLAALLVLLAPTVVATLSLRLVAALRRLVSQRAQALPRIRLERAVRRQLARVREEASPASAEAFFVELSHNLRTYLEATLSIPAHASTTHELQDAFASKRLQSRHSGQLAEILATADRVKFGGDSAATPQMVATGERLIALVGDMERSLAVEVVDVES